MVDRAKTQRDKDVQELTVSCHYGLGWLWGDFHIFSQYFWQLKFISTTTLKQIYRAIAFMGLPDKCVYVSLSYSSVQHMFMGLLDKGVYVSLRCCSTHVCSSKYLF